MKTFFFMLIVSVSCIADDLSKDIYPNNLKNREFSDAEALSKKNASVKEKTNSSSCLGLTPLRILLSPACPRSFVWVEATVSEKIEEDTYFIQDKSNSMILFLPTDELAATPLSIGSHILIYGTVDISPVTSTKNELYAEKIIFP